MRRHRFGKDIMNTRDGNEARFWRILRPRQFRHAHGWTLPVKVLYEMHNEGIETVAFDDVMERKRYTAPLRAFYERGIRHVSDWGEAIALPLSLWHVEELREW